jgi:hypothetical protein
VLGRSYAAPDDAGELVATATGSFAVITVG